MTANSPSFSSRLRQRRALAAPVDGLPRAAACLHAQLLRNADLGRELLNPVIARLYFGAAQIAVFLVLDGYSAQVPANRLRSAVAALKATPYVGLLALLAFFTKPYELTRPVVALSVLFGLFLVIAMRLLLAILLLELHGRYSQTSCPTW